MNNASFTVVFAGSRAKVQLVSAGLDTRLDNGTLDIASYNKYIKSTITTTTTTLAPEVT
jgi:hypothetical protein